MFLQRLPLRKIHVKLKDLILVVIAAIILPTRADRPMTVRRPRCVSGRHCL